MRRIGEAALGNPRTQLRKQQRERLERRNQAGFDKLFNGALLAPGHMLPQRAGQNATRRNQGSRFIRLHVPLQGRNIHDTGIGREQAQAIGGDACERSMRGAATLSCSKRMRAA